MNQDYIFICYAREDVEMAKRVYLDLKQANLNPWLDIECLLPGQRWKAEIKKIIRESAFFLALLSSDSVSKRGYVHNEMKEAIDVLRELPENQTYIIPARLNECTPSYEVLKEFHWLDLFPSYEAGMSKLLKVLEPQSEGASATQAAEQISQSDDKLQVPEAPPLELVAAVEEVKADNATPRSFAAIQARLFMLITVKSDMDLQLQSLNQHRMYVANAQSGFFNLMAEYKPGSRASKVLEDRIEQLNEAGRILSTHSAQLASHLEAVVQEIEELEYLYGRKSDSTFKLL